MRTPLRTLLGVATIALVVGCRKADSARDASAPASAPPGVPSASSAPAAPRTPRAGDLTIITTDSAVALSLEGDTVAMRLSDKVLAQARHDMEKDKDHRDSSAFGASIERMVKSTVSSALGTRITYALTDLDDVRYDGGAIKFDYRRRKHLMSFESVKPNKRPALESFEPVDARRFVAAVRAAKGKG